MINGLTVNNKGGMRDGCDFKIGKKFQVTYEVVTPAKEIKMIKELFDNYEDAAKRKELLDGETCMFSPDSLFVDVMEDWLADPYFRDL